ncbi:MAG: hypothetical protein M3R36_14695 [Bacteroidota bacterium]|nr:hypothetical protein [Bacteroidota bacterium]
MEVHNTNPLDLFKDKLKKVWGAENKRKIIWKIKMKAGKNKIPNPSSQIPNQSHSHLKTFIAIA